MLLAQPLQDKIRDTLYLLPQIQIGLLVIRFSPVSDNRSLVLHGTIHEILPSYSNLVHYKFKAAMT